MTEKHDGLEREVYEAALSVLQSSCLGVDVTRGVRDDGRSVEERLPYAFDDRRVDLAKWIICNIWGPTGEP